MFAYRTKGVAALLACAQGLLVWLWLLTLGRFWELASEAGHLASGALSFLGLPVGFRLGLSAGAPLAAGWEPAHWLMPWAAGIACEALGWGLRGAAGGNAGLALRRVLVPASVFSAFEISRLGSVAHVSPMDLFAFASTCGILAFLYHSGPGWISRAFFLGQHLQKTVVIGPPEHASKLFEVLEQQRRIGIQPVGWFSQESLRPSAQTPQDLSGGALDGAFDWESVVTRKGVQQVVLAGPASDTEAALGVVAACERLGVRLLLAQRLCDFPGKRLTWEAQGEWTLGALYREPLQNPVNRLAKRILDVVFALCVVVCVLAPVCVVTWLMQRRQSPGPLFYRQWRTGRENQRFCIWKFRTMHVHGSPASLQASRGDSRIYPFGLWLRRHSLDELPQFLNVLTGEMSVVGPRPHLEAHTETFSVQERYHIRSFVKPGITGLAQVNGCRGEVHSPSDLERRVAWDIQYVENWSFWLDLKLIFQTAAEVVSPPESAY